MNLAAMVASWSKDPSTQVGCVLVDTSDHRRRIIATGYNGFPAGMSDAEKLYTDREFKYCHVVHAEENALNNLSGTEKSIVLFSTFPVCPDCMHNIYGARRRGVIVVKIIQPYLDCCAAGKPESWKQEWLERIAQSACLAKKYNIDVELMDV